ncbi:Hsp33 protein [Fragilaria crotonensis]|nr:Hsp33 protein [Fragilaria crotonensis]
MLLTLAITTCRLRSVNAFAPTISPFLRRLHKQSVLHAENSEGSSASSAAMTSTILDEYQNRNNLNDQVFSAISRLGIKVTVATIRNLLNDAMIMHTLTATPADALGRLLTCSLLLSNGMQLEQTLQLTLNSDGPLRGVMALSTGSGRVKGYVGSPQIGDMPLSEAIGMTPVQIAEIILKDLEIQPLQQILPAFACDCTDDRLLRALRLLPRQEIEELLLNEEQLEARCQFCGKVYRMGPEQVRERLGAVKGDPSRDENA